MQVGQNPKVRLSTDSVEPIRLTSVKCIMSTFRLTILKSISWKEKHGDFWSWMNLNSYVYFGMFTNMRTKVLSGALLLLQVLVIPIQGTTVLCVGESGHSEFESFGAECCSIAISAVSEVSIAGQEIPSECVSCTDFQLPEFGRWAQTINDRGQLNSLQNLGHGSNAPAVCFHMFIQELLDPPEFALDADFSVFTAATVIRC